MTAEPGYAACPACETVFRVPAELAAPRVRCGVCEAPFDLAPARVGDPWAVSVADSPQASGLAPGLAPVAAEATVRTALPLRPRPLPLPRAGLTPLGMLLGLALVLGLLALAVGQVLWFGREALAARPGTRVLVEAFCARAGCQLPPWRELDAYLIEAPRVKLEVQRGALVATATLVNQARFAQPAPKLELRLLDATGEITQARIFTPPEYWPPAATAPDARPAVQSFSIGPGQRVQARLELLDPGPGAQDFAYTLHW